MARRLLGNRRSRLQRAFSIQSSSGDIDTSGGHATELDGVPQLDAQGDWADRGAGVVKGGDSHVPRFAGMIEDAQDSLDIMD